MTRVPLPAMRVPPRRLEAVVLDLDGVLVDSERINVGSARRAFAAHGVALDAEDEALIVGRHPRDYLAEIAARHPDAARRLAEIAALQGRLYAELGREVRPVPGALDLVRALRARGTPLALATSSNRDDARAVLAALGVADAFDAVLALEDVAKLKPDPEIYRRACGALAVAPDRAAAVEDSPPGCLAARGAGMCVIAFDPGGRLPPDVPADVVAATHGEVLAWLLSRLDGSAAR